MNRTAISSLAGAALLGLSMAAAAFSGGNAVFAAPGAAGFGDSFTRDADVVEALHGDSGPGPTTIATTADDESASVAARRPLPAGSEDDVDGGHFFDRYFDHHLERHFLATPAEDEALPILDTE